MFFKEEGVHKGKSTLGPKSHLGSRPESELPVKSSGFEEALIDRFLQGQTLHCH